jgi:hypothetical protein
MARSVIRRPDRLALAVLACLVAAPAWAEEQVISATIDTSDQNAASEAIALFMGALPAFPTRVGIDLTILPDPDGVLGVVLVGKVGEEGTPVTCEDGGFGRISGEYSEIRFPALSVYNHMLLEVDLNGQSAQTGLVIGCEYRGSTAPAFRMMGQFLVSKLSIPTAEDVLMVARPAD